MIGSSDREEREASDVVSIVGPGMAVEGDCATDGTLRVEGRVEGSVRAEKAVVIGEDGEVVGDVHTQDAVVAGSVTGTIVARSRLELQATARVEGDIRCRRVKLEEGGFVEGRVEMSGDGLPGDEDEGESGRSPQGSTGSGPAGGVEA